jgi:hypothetical protein
MLQSLASWVCNAVVSGWVYKKFQLEKPGEVDTAATVRGNARLFQFFEELRGRHNRLATILYRGIAAETWNPLLFGGCYMAGTGSDSAEEQAFVAGVFRRLIDEQDYVSWSDEALQEEATRSHVVRLGYGFLSVLVLAGLALGAYFFYQQKTGSS